MAGGVAQVARPAPDFVNGACPCPPVTATWKAIKISPPFVAMVGWLRSKRGKVCPVGHADAKSPHWRAPLPGNWLGTNGGKGHAVAPLPKARPPPAHPHTPPPLA